MPYSYQNSSSAFVDTGQYKYKSYTEYKQKELQEYGVVSGRVIWVAPDSKVKETIQGKIETFELKIKDFPPVIASSIFAANAPEILKPIETSQGVYLIWVEKIIHPKLDEQLRAQIQQDLFVAWLKQQSEQLKIVIQENLDSNYSINQSNIKVNAEMNN